MEKETCFRIYPIGYVKKETGRVFLDIKEAFLDAMSGLDDYSHIMVFYWFDKNDHEEGRGTLKVRPRKDPQNPLTGVFATHSPLRPNLVALTFCKILSIDGCRIEIEDIDALDRSPIVDIKPHIPLKMLENVEIRLPEWLNKKDE